MEGFLKEMHSVVGIYTGPLSSHPEGQTKEPFRMLEEMFYSKSYISNVTRELEIYMNSAVDVQITLDTPHVPVQN